MGSESKIIRAATICAAVFSIIFTCIAAAPAVIGQSTPSVDNIYVTNAASDTVQVLDSSSGAVVATISDVGSHPGSILLSPDGSRAYVAVTDSGSGASTIAFIDISSHSVTKKVTIPGAISDIGIRPDGKILYVLAYDNVMYIDTSSGKITDSWQLPKPYSRMSVGPDGTSLFISTQAYGMMDFDATSGSISYLGGWHGSDITPNRGGSSVYLCDNTNSTVIVTDTELGVDATQISTSSYGKPERVILSPDGSRVYVLTDRNQVIGINVQSNAIVSSWDLGDRQASEMTNSPDGKRLYVTCADNANARGDIAVINLDDNSIRDIFTSVGINGIVARQVAAAVVATPTATATPTPTVTASPTLQPTGTALAGTSTVSPQASATTTVSPSSFGNNSGICPLIPISFAGLILLGIAGRKKK